jgi:hypothetical protein
MFRLAERRRLVQSWRCATNSRGSAPHRWTIFALLFFRKMPWVADNLARCAIPAAVCSQDAGRSRMTCSGGARVFWCQVSTSQRARLRMDYGVVLTNPITSGLVGIRKLASSGRNPGTDDERPTTPRGSQSGVYYGTSIITSGGPQEPPPETSHGHAARSCCEASSTRRDS